MKRRLLLILSGLLVFQSTNPFPLWFNFDAQPVHLERSQPVQTPSVWGLLKFGAAVGCSIGFSIGIVKAHRWYRRLVAQRDAEQKSQNDRLQREKFQLFLRGDQPQRLYHLLKYQNVIEEAHWGQRPTRWGQVDNRLARAFLSVAIQDYGSTNPWALDGFSFYEDTNPINFIGSQIRQVSEHRNRLYSRFIHRVAQAEYDLTIKRIMSQKQQWTLDDYLRALRKELKIFMALNLSHEQIGRYERIGFDMYACLDLMWKLHRNQIDKLLEFQALPNGKPCITLDNANDDSEKTWRDSFEFCFRRISYVFRDSCYVGWQREKIINNLMYDLFADLFCRVQTEEASSHQKAYILKQRLKTVIVDKDLLPGDGSLTGLVKKFC